MWWTGWWVVDIGMMVSHMTCSSLREGGLRLGVGWAMCEGGPVVRYIQ
jgi:hypothetical protein